MTKRRKEEKKERMWNEKELRGREIRCETLIKLE